MVKSNGHSALFGSQRECGEIFDWRILLGILQCLSSYLTLLVAWIMNVLIKWMVHMWPTSVVVIWFFSWHIHWIRINFSWKHTIYRIGFGLVILFLSIVWIPYYLNQGLLAFVHPRSRNAGLALVKTNPSITIKLIWFSHISIACIQRTESKAFYEYLWE